MQTFENLYSRRSIRSYTGEGLSETELAEILKSAYAAPVGKAQYQSLPLPVYSRESSSFYSKRRYHGWLHIPKPFMKQYIQILSGFLF